MTDREIAELAAILVNEYGHAALDVAERRRAQHAHEPHSDSYRVWTRIAQATARLLRRNGSDSDAGSRCAAATPDAAHRGRRM